MAFDFFKWMVGGKEKDGQEENPTNIKVSAADFMDNSVDVVRGLEVYLQRMAFWTCVRKIGQAVGAVEWETFRRGKSVKAREYWAWNNNPNPNQNKQEFFMRLIAQLFLQQEALVVEHNGHRYVADSFAVQGKLSGNIYQDIYSNGENIPGIYSAADVLHFTIEGERIKAILSSIAAAEGALMRSSSASFIRNSGRHGILNIDELAESDKDFEDTYSNLINNDFKKYFTAENAVLPLYTGYEYKENEKDIRQQETTRDIRAMMDDIVELTAQTIGMPVTVATGKQFTEADFKTFMTFTVQPLVKMIAEEINRKVYGQALVYSGTYVSPNMGGVKYIDLFDVANPIDKLIGSGAFCINDIRIRLGMDIIDAPWAWQHWMTKNYSSVQDLLTGVEEENNNDSKKEESEGEE